MMKCGRLLDLLNISPSPLIGCVTLSKSLNLPEFLFLLLKSGAITIQSPAVGMRIKCFINHRMLCVDRAIITIRVYSEESTMQKVAEVFDTFLWPPELPSIICHPCCHC